MQGLDAIENKLKKMQEARDNMPRFAIDALIENEAFVLDMIFEEQLYMEGVNGRNVPIMDFQPYSPATIWYKEQKGQPTDRVTLRDEGDFASDGDIERLDDLTAEVISRDWKSDHLQRKYGKEILILKPDNLNELREYYIKPELLKKMQEI